METKKVLYEEALTMTGFGKYNILEMLLLSCMTIGMAVETSSVAYLVPASACELLTTPEQQGLMAGMPLVGILAASNVWGYFADTRGRRKILFTAMIMGFIAGSAATFSPNWIVFCILKFLAAAAMAGTYGLTSALLSECTPVAYRSKSLLLLTSVFATSVGCMAVLTIPVLSLTFSFYVPYLDIHFNSWRLLNLIYSIAPLLGAITAYVAFESPKYLLSVGRHEEALDILRKIYVLNSGEDGSFYKVSAVVLDEDCGLGTNVGFWKSVIHQTVPLFKPPLVKNTLLLSAIFITVYFTVNPFTVWVPYMIDGFMKSLAKGETGLSFCQMLRSSQNDSGNLNDEFNGVLDDDMSPKACTFNSTAMLLVFGMDLILASMNIVASMLLPYIGRRNLLIGIQMIAGAAALMVNFSTSWQMTAFLIVAFVHGMLNFGLLNTFSVDMFPTYVKAMGVCLTLMIGRGSAVLGINLLKSLLTYHCDATFYIFGSISIVGGLMGFLLPEVLCHAQTGKVGLEQEHSHPRDRPCAVCPRHGKCVPRIQCPAMMRPGSFNPECHLESKEIGVCCFTGSRHASESDLKLRSSSISVEDVKAAHHQSHQRLSQWTTKTERLLARSTHTVVNTTAPSFAHHLSMVTHDKRAQNLARGALLNLFAAQELKARQVISDDELSYGLTEHTDGPFCPPPPVCPNPPSRYRSMGGECNNPANPSWGAANTGFERILPPDYSDGTVSFLLVSPTSLPSRYRSMGGECNNPANPTWGAANTGFERILPPDYSDGKESNFLLASTTSLPSRYRSMGGECNNPANPTWGAANTGFERILPPDYSDGKESNFLLASTTSLPSRYRSMGGECNNPANPTWGAANTGFERILPPDYSDAWGAANTGFERILPPDYSDGKESFLLASSTSLPSRYRSMGGACNNPVNPAWGAANTGFERILPPDYSDGKESNFLLASTTSLPSRYRSMGGECNNPANPTWGAANTGFERILPPDYSDGKESNFLLASTTSLPSRYRSMGGECNYPANPTWGAANTGFERILLQTTAMVKNLSFLHNPPGYHTGTWAMKASSSGLPLPSARMVSAVLIPDGSYPSPTHSMLFMQFGQFIAHDTSAGVTFTLGNGSAISCCTNDGEGFLDPELQHWACAPIVADPQDAFYGQYRHKCMNFVRTQLAPNGDCSVGYGKQMNGATHYPDLSHLYGSTPEKVQSLRAPGGLLAVFNDYGRELPPLTTTGDCLSVKEGSACFESGDSHGNQIISLTIFHTIWTREHNRIARALIRLNPAWDEETVYYEARRLVQAEFQHIIYSEWLPALLGPQMMQTFGLNPSAGYASSYDPHVNPSLTAEFSTAAMRFGHSIVDGRITVPHPSTNSVYETLSIPEVMFQPARLRLKHFLDRTILGLSRQPMQSVDPFVTEGLTRYLFHGGNPFGLDLATINIQRGRDWGVRSYNHYRRLIGLPAFDDFYQFGPVTAQRLSSVYSSPEDIDLWIGGLLEEAVEGGIVGPTFAHIIADQFSKLKRGDRYFYEYGADVNPGAFSPSQLAEIKKVTLARILCDNADGIELISLPPRAFLRADLPGNEPVACDNYAIPSIDLSRFRDI
ncbi:peroxidase domain-containing protein [Phthorimaea operculella]|nr:peroxidase domain-containing protein [Phthorimaea operculella]